MGDKETADIVLEDTGAKSPDVLKESVLEFKDEIFDETLETSHSPDSLSEDNEENKDDNIQQQSSVPSTNNKTNGSSESDTDISQKSEKLRSSGIPVPSFFTSSFESLKSLARQTSAKDVNVTVTSPTQSVEDNANEEKILNMNVERKNLLGMAKLSVKGLIESSLSENHTLDSDHGPLQQFFVIMEYVFRHGLKARKNIFIQNKYFWPALESIEKVTSDVLEVNDSVRSLPGVKTYLGKGRAWLRLVVMQKKMADYIKVLTENKKLLCEYYEEGALLLNDEATVLTGHLVGLNCIDANLCMKEDDLDNQNTIIDYSSFMKDGNKYMYIDESEYDNEKNEDTIQSLMDQKNYLEERNRHLETNSSELQKKYEQLQNENKDILQKLDASEIISVALKAEQEKTLSEKIELNLSHQKALEIREKDLDIERETLLQSRAGLDEMCNQYQNQLKRETQLRLDIEKELELQMSVKQELEMAMKLLERDIFEKQDGLITLREQLDNVKAINMDIYKKLQTKTELVEENSKKITGLEKDTQGLKQRCENLLAQLSEADRQTDVAREQAHRYSEQLDDNEKKSGVLLTNFTIEKEWREALQSKNQQCEEKLVLYEEKLQITESLKEELANVTMDRNNLRETCQEQEQTIHDLAGHLGQSKQDLGDLQVVHKSLTGNTWESDKEVKQCFQCQKQFSLARRKHHCRNCGQIYCNACSDNTMPLASSAKPVRVCDTCHTTLLQNFSAGT